MARDLLARREPFGSLFDEFFNDFLGRPGFALTRAAELPTVTRARMDVIDRNDKYEVLVDLPGVKKEDIQVTIAGNRVAIAAETRSEKETREGERLIHSERYAASYGRSFELPTEVTEQGAEASFENGVLRLALPKKAAVTSRRLTVS